MRRYFVGVVLPTVAATLFAALPLHRGADHHQHNYLHCLHLDAFVTKFDPTQQGAASLI